MVNEKRIREMISEFAKIYNSWLDNPPLEKNDYSLWPKSFSGEESLVANQIYNYINKKNNTPSTRILSMGAFHEEKLLEEILLSSPLQKA